MGRYNRVICDILNNQSPSFSSSFDHPFVEASSNISIIDGYSSDDESVNNEKNCPPPPVKSVEQQTQRAQQTIVAIQSLYKRHALWIMAQYVLDSRTRRKGRIKNLQNLSVAHQFYHYITLLRYFSPWMEIARYRKQQIRINGLLLKKILHIWNAAAGREIQKKCSAMAFMRILAGFSPGGCRGDCAYYDDGYGGGLARRVLSCAIQRWNEYCWDVRFASKVFIGWRLRTRIQRFRYSVAEEKVVILSIQNRKRVVLRAWREHRLIIVSEDHTKRWILKRVFGNWKTGIQQAMIKEEEMLREPRMLTFQKNVCRRHLWRAFQQLRHYALKRTHYRWAYRTLQTQYHRRLVRTSIEQWKDYKILSTRRQRMLVAIILRQHLHQWQQTAKEQKQKEHIVLQIIFNRWRIYTEERIERRVLRKVAHGHWCNCMRGKIFGAWRSTIMREKGRIRTPIFNKSNMNWNASCFQKRLRSRSPFGPRREKRMPSGEPSTRHIPGTTRESLPLNSTHLGRRRSLSLDVETRAGMFYTPERNRGLSHDARERSCSALRGVNDSSKIEHSWRNGYSTQSKFSNQCHSRFRLGKSPSMVIGHASRQGRCPDISQEKTSSYPDTRIFHKTSSPTNNQGDDGFRRNPLEEYEIISTTSMMPPALRGPRRRSPLDLGHLGNWRNEGIPGFRSPSQGSFHSVNSRHPLEKLSVNPSIIQNQKNNIPLTSRTPSWAHDAVLNRKWATTSEAKCDNDSTPVRQSKNVYQRGRRQGEFIAEQKWTSSPSWNERK